MCRARGKPSDGGDTEPTDSRTQRRSAEHAAWPDRHDDLGACPAPSSGSRCSVGRTARRGQRAPHAVLLVAAAALGVGVAARAADPAVGFSFAVAVGAIASQLPVTGPAALALSAAMALELAAGAVFMRALRRTPFPSWSEALLEGYAGAVVLDVLLLFALAGEGLFRGPLLAGILAAVGLAGTRLRPIVRRRPAFGRLYLGRWPLIVLAWCGPLVLTLASPVVPFSDVLPNHVAPVEHLAVFGTFATLATSPSPIYGASRVFQGYAGLLGSLATLTGLPATLAVAAFAVPVTLVSALAARRLAAVLFGRQAGYWALLVFPLSFTFVRLTDARDSVTALPLAACALVLLVRPAIRGGPTRLPRGPDLPLGATLAATVLVHPLVGAFSAATVLVVTLSDPRRYGRRVVPALAGAVVACLPEAAVMAGYAPVPAVGLVAFGAALATAELLARLAEHPTTGRPRAAVRPDERAPHVASRGRRTRRRRAPRTPRSRAPADGARLAAPRVPGARRRGAGRAARPAPRGPRGSPGARGIAGSRPGRAPTGRPGPGIRSTRSPCAMRSPKRSATGCPGRAAGQRRCACRDLALARPGGGAPRDRRHVPGPRAAAARRAGAQHRAGLAPGGGHPRV